MAGNFAPTRLQVGGDFTNASDIASTTNALGNSMLAYQQQGIANAAADERLRMEGQRLALAKAADKRDAERLKLTTDEATRQQLKRDQLVQASKLALNNGASGRQDAFAKEVDKLYGNKGTYSTKATTTYDTELAQLQKQYANDPDSYNQAVDKLRYGTDAADAIKTLKTKYKGNLTPAQSKEYQQKLGEIYKDASNNVPQYNDAGQKELELIGNQYATVAQSADGFYGKQMSDDYEARVQQYLVSTGNYSPEEALKAAKIMASNHRTTGTTAAERKNQLDSIDKQQKEFLEMLAKKHEQMKVSSGKSATKVKKYSNDSNGWSNLAQEMAKEFPNTDWGPNAMGGEDITIYINKLAKNGGYDPNDVRAALYLNASGQNESYLNKDKEAGIDGVSETLARLTAQRNSNKPFDGIVPVITKYKYGAGYTKDVQNAIAKFNAQRAQLGLTRGGDIKDSGADALLKRLEGLNTKKANKQIASTVPSKYIFKGAPTIAKWMNSPKKDALRNFQESNPKKFTAEYNKLNDTQKTQIAPYITSVIGDNSPKVKNDEYTKAFQTKMTNALKMDDTEFNKLLLDGNVRALLNGANSKDKAALNKRLNKLEDLWDKKKKKYDSLSGFQKDLQALKKAIGIEGDVSEAISSKYDNLKEASSKKIADVVNYFAGNGTIDDDTILKLSNEAVSKGITAKEDIIKYITGRFDTPDWSKYNQPTRPADNSPEVQAELLKKAQYWINR